MILSGFSNKVIMKIVNKQFTLNKIENLSVEHIENFILKSGFEPLRWAVVKVEGDNIVIDATVLKN